VIEIFQEDISRFPVLLVSDLEGDPIAQLGRGEIPELSALRLHNGTVYRWNRPCYGVSDGVPHLRIENRSMPAGPTVIDEIANAALFYGLMAAFAEERVDFRTRMPFESAKENFFAAARFGLKAQFTWLDRAQHSAAQLLLEDLIPRARAGLQHAAIDSADIDRYLGILKERVRSGQTGARWLLDSIAGMPEKMTRDLKARNLSSNLLEKQLQGDPVHTWDLAEVRDSDDWRRSYLRVGQFMTTDLFTIAPDDVVDLAASLMDWRHIRHVPVEDHDGRLVGLVSHRSLLRLVSLGLGSGEEQIPVHRIMRKDLITVTPDTTTLDAIELMRERGVGCLPVVDDGVLVGIISERDLMSVARSLLERHLREEREGE
jgi:CBS domain-containing protein